MSSPNPSLDSSTPSGSSLLRQIRLQPSFFALLLVFSLLVIVTGATQEPVLTPDSKSYINGNLQRPPVYPLTIALLRVPFGENALQAVVAFQTAFGCFAALALTLFLQIRLQLNRSLTLVCLVLLLGPYYNFPFPPETSSHMHIGNNILTEAMSYAFLLLAIRYLLGALLDRRNRDFVLYLVFATFTILTRSQFLFLYAISILVLLYLCSVRRPLRRNIFAISAVIATLILCPLLERTYHYFKHDMFAKSPFGTFQLVASALYLSDAEDVALFEDENALFFSELRARAAEKGLLLADSPPRKGILLDMWHYTRSYNQILWGTFRPLVFEQHPDLESQIQLALIRINPSMRSMVVSLAVANFGSHLWFYLSNVLGSTAVREELLIFVALIVSLYRTLRYADPAALALATVLLLHVSNYALVALVEPIIPRYTFYTDTVYPVFFMIFLFSLMVNRRSGANNVSVPAEPQDDSSRMK